MNKDLYNHRSFDDVPLEMMPYLLEMLQQRIGFDCFGKDVAPKDMHMNSQHEAYYGTWNPLSRKREKRAKRSKEIESLSRVYDVIMSWQSLPQLFVRGPGDSSLSNVHEDEETHSSASKTKKSKSKPHKRRKFGDAGDDDDEPFIPANGRKRGKWERNSETEKWAYVPPPVY